MEKSSMNLVKGSGEWRFCMEPNKFQEDAPTSVSWADLPPELLPLIAGYLGIVELLSFRGACKIWRASASLATAQIQSSPGRHPWFLLYNNHNQSCLLLRADAHNRYHISIPELSGSTCIASSEGWLLLHRGDDDSLFFFSPFSRNRIDLPPLPFPFNELPDKVAAFSSPPVSQDCTVCVPNRRKYGFGVLLLSRGEEKWTVLELGYLIKDFGPLTCTTYCNDKFCFRDDSHSLLTFCSKDKTPAAFRITKPDESDKLPQDIPRAPFMLYKRQAENYKSRFWRRHINDWLGCSDTDDIDIDISISISTCGTLVTKTDQRCAGYISNEIEPDDRKGSDGFCVTGVWIHPRFFELDQQELRWSL